MGLAVDGAWITEVGTLGTLPPLPAEPESKAAMAEDGPAGL
jgi:hypothetical protein